MARRRNLPASFSNGWMKIFSQQPVPARPLGPTSPKNGLSGQPGFLATKERSSCLKLSSAR